MCAYLGAIWLHIYVHVYVFRYNPFAILQYLGYLWGTVQQQKDLGGRKYIIIGADECGNNRGWGT